MQNLVRFAACVLPLLLVAAEVRAVDTSSLQPPKGSAVALIVFEDLQCPDCARAAPLLVEAAHTYKIPLVRHDFPLPQHNWSFQAAVYARYFDTKSEKLGDAYRDELFRNQPSITPVNLRTFTEKFAANNKVQLPMLIDPGKKLEEKVRADYALGQRIGIEHTPTIYVASHRTTGEPFVEVVDRSSLYTMIDEMKRGASAEPASAPAKPKRRARQAVKRTTLR